MGLGKEARGETQRLMAGGSLAKVLLQKSRRRSQRNAHGRSICGPTLQRHCVQQQEVVRTSAKGSGLK